jgi:hypothetical protein
MSNDAEARELHATVTDSGEPREPVDSDQTERKDRPDLVGADDEVIDADAVIIAEDTGEPSDLDDLDDLDEAEDDTHPDTVPAEAIVAEPVAAEAAAAEPVAASGPGGPRHAAADSGPARPGMPVNGEVPEGIQMAGDPEQLHQRWAAIQSTFVDDPRGSVTSAAALVTEVIDTVVASAKQRENGLRGGWERDGADTEALRNALRGYRALLDQLVAL